MTSENIHQRIDSFQKRFGEPHLYLAYHAAFPLSLTPDLTYRIWMNFQRDNKGNILKNEKGFPLNIPWIAVSDLLLSDFCNEVAHELYEMDQEIRNELLKRMRADERFGRARIKQLSEFLLKYIEDQLNSHDPYIRNFANAQKWITMAYTEPNKIARELAEALSSRVKENDKSGIIRAASLIETVAEPLIDDGLEYLLSYSSGMEQYAKDKIEEAKEHINKFQLDKDRIKISDIPCHIPNDLLEERSISSENQDVLETTIQNDNLDNHVDSSENPDRIIQTETRKSFFDFFKNIFFRKKNLKQEADNDISPKDIVLSEKSVSDEIDKHEPEIITQSEEDEASPAPEYIEVSSLQDMAEESPVVRLVNSILAQAIRERVSDIHISPEKEDIQMRFRMDGKLHEVPHPPKHMILPIISRLKILANMDISVFRVPQDGRFTAKMSHKEVNIRVSTIPTIYGENMVLRLSESSVTIYPLKELGMSEEDFVKIESMLYKSQGMILTSGPTASGKTTSLYSIIKKINQPDINIITIEDPVEYRLEKVRQIQLNRKAGMTFASGIRSIMRQDPDVIMIGEIRDPETAVIAVQAAMTGRRVLSSLHTNNAAGAITRFLDMGIAPFLLSSVLLILINQRLIRRVCPDCAKPYTPSETVLKYWGLESYEDAHFVQAEGCLQCLNTGYKGRTGIFEVLLIDKLVQEMILQNKSASEIALAAQKAGNFKTLRENAIEKVLKGVTTFDEISPLMLESL